MNIQNYGRFFTVYDSAGELICVTVYRKGAREVVRRIAEAQETRIVTGNFATLAAKRAEAHAH